MEEIWKRVCIHYDIPDDVSNSWFCRIKQRLSQPDPSRAYHNWHEMIMRKSEHLEKCNPSIILAVLFQYYVYNGNRNCAKENCAAFEEFCHDAQIDDVATKDLIFKLLGHRNNEMGELVDSYEQDAKLLQDLDLIVLAAPLDDYKVYTNLLRQEYADINDQSYNQMRLKLSPTSRRPVLVNELDEARFKKFRDKLNSRMGRVLNSTPLNILISPKLNKKNTKAAKKIFLHESSFDANANAKKNIAETIKAPVSTKPSDTIEEGEIRTDDDETHRNVSADDDCICIEEEIEQIVIEDTETDILYFEDKTKTQIVDLTPKRKQNRSRNKSSTIVNDDKAGVNDDEVIVIDDTIVVDDLISPNALNNNNDKSVNFDSMSSLPDYIPLTSDDVPKPIKVSPNPAAHKKQKYRDSLFSVNEKKQLESYNQNAYNPNSDTQKEQRRENPKRMVIVDGSNVAYAHSRKGVFSVKGLQICIEYFKKMGHEVKAVLPLYRLHKMKSTDPAALEALHKEGVVVLTPCKNLPGLSSSSYDDRFILQLASELDAAIVSNDNYRDLINENSAFKKLIENRVIGYTWCDDVFILPKDPYGKFGPTLHSILNRQIVSSS